jgi:hypothetical protein
LIILTSSRQFFIMCFFKGYFAMVSLSQKNVVSKLIASCVTSHSAADLQCVFYY